MSVIKCTAPRGPPRDVNTALIRKPYRPLWAFRCFSLPRRTSNIVLGLDGVSVYHRHCCCYTCKPLSTVNMSRPSSMSQRPLTLTEELEKLEQSITLTLQGKQR